MDDVASIAQRATHRDGIGRPRLPPARHRLHDRRGKTAERFVDAVATAVPGGTPSTTALAGSSEADRFHDHIIAARQRKNPEARQPGR
jgi:hypothetical protein